jgi:DNA invertase Pin-like site-specific DNA recombinase
MTSKYVALYCRLSPRPDGKYEGVDSQEKWGRQYAATVWPGMPVEVFADKGLSAASEDTHRPQFERLREWVAAGRIAHVWTVEQTRIERKEIQWFVLAAELDTAGIHELHTKRDGIVRVRDAVAGIKAVLAADEVRRLKKRVNDRLDEIAAEGRPAAGVHFAHRRAVDQDGNKILVLDEDDAAVVREVAGRVLDGWGLITIANDLTARGVRGKNGGRLSPRGIKGMVTSPSVAGHRVHRGRIVRRGCFPAVLDESTWQAVCARLSQPRRVRRTDGQPDIEINEKFFGKSGARKYLMTGGYVICAVCRAPLTGSTRKMGNSDVPYLECHRQLGGRGCVGIKMEPVDKYVLNELWAELDKPEFLEQLNIDGYAARRDEIGVKLTALQARRRQLAERWGAGDMLDVEWQAARQSITTTENVLNDELAAMPPPAIGMDIGTAQQAWPDMTLEEQREFLGLFISHVTIAKGWRGKKSDDGVNTARIDIEWKRR